MRSGGGSGRGRSGRVLNEIVRVMRLNVEKAQSAVANVAKALVGKTRTCGCGEALKGGIITDPKAIPPAVVENLRPIIGKYL